VIFAVNYDSVVLTHGCKLASVILGAVCCASMVASFCNCECEHWRPGCVCLPATQNCPRIQWHLTLGNVALQ